MSNRPGSISPLLSVVLDATRLGLSLMVVVGHWTQRYFQTEWPDLTAFAVAAVGGFFVLSGFTIRMIYPSSDGFSLRKYMSERLSRIFSVTILALVLTLVLDTISSSVNPGYYSEHWGRQADQPLLRSLINLLGVSQVWGMDVAPLSNSPFWSISYELGFYVVFGFWLAGYRWLAAATLVVLGPNIAVMFAFWLTGVAAYELCCRNPVRLWMAVTLAVTGVVAGLAIYAFGGPIIDDFFASLGVGRARVSRVLGASCAMFFAIYVPLIWLANRVQFRIPDRWMRRARWLGNMTFPLYLLHFPAFVLIGALGLHDRSSDVQKVGLLVLVIALIGLTAPLTDRIKVALRGRRMAAAPTLPNG